MGLLDDAIREHLDLKRARGGDPAELERMEREALGPVRREPTIGSARFDTADEHTSPPPVSGYPDDRDELLQAGYHDSTAPHPHEHHERADPYFEHEHDGPFAAQSEQPEQPKRRFLRRNRPAAVSDSVLPDAGFHEDPAADPHGMLEHDELLEHHGSSEHYDLLEHHEPVGHAEPLEHPESPTQHEAPGERMPSGTPPHLQFDHPPKRPRFSPEPPSPHPDDEPATGAHQPVEQPVVASAAPQPPGDPDNDADVQETTEFDVQKHIAETRFQPDPETRAHPSPAPPATEEAAEVNEAAEKDDVLEETPEFLQDTPEHDRLWFEQRPPRDFDFDG